jgi:protein-tyrosine phosphatase
VTTGTTPPQRALAWEGCSNVRDLGGLRTAGGRETAWRAVVRSDSPERLTAAGWEALAAYGIRTIVDLRNEDELGGEPAGVEYVHLPLDGAEDAEFWAEWGSGPQFGTPLYYRPHLERFPERNAAAVRAIARAQPGGVLFHCVGGRDRTGQVAMLLLALAGVAPEEIAADYRLSGNDEGDEFLARRGTSSTEVILETLDGLDVETYLRASGVNDADLAGIRRRLSAPEPP